MSFESYAPLERIRPNPWQPRETVDQEEIQKLAQSIQEIGLLQPPVARKADENTYELAFGHRRLAAYQYLLSLEPAPATIIAAVPSKWAMMPLVVQPLTDEEMFRYAISENVKRQDLNPIEEARAMARYRDEFRKTSAEIGELFGLSDSAVRNKIRLLQLPADVQKAVMERRIAERVLRELVNLFSIPEDLRERAGSQIPRYYSEIWPSSIVREALNGETAEKIHELVDRMVRYVSTAMDDAVFKHDRVFEGIVCRWPTCKECDVRFVLTNGVFCGDKTCYEAKQLAAKRDYLQEVSLLCGIPVHDNPQIPSHEVTTFWSADKVERVRATGCENLRLIYSHHKEDHVDGYPHAEIICTRRSGQCTCERMLNKGVDIIEQPVEPQGKTLAEVFGGSLTPDLSPENGRGETEAPAQTVTRITHKPVTAEELREIDRRMRRERRQNLEECRGIREVATQRIFQALEERNPVIWLEVTRKLVGYSRAEKLAGEPVMELWLAIAERIASDLYDWTYREPDPKDALRIYNELMKKAELPEIESMLETVSAETEEE